MMKNIATIEKALDLLHQLEPVLKELDPKGNFLLQSYYFIERYLDFEYRNSKVTQDKDKDKDKDKKSDGSELEKDYSAKTGKPLITDNERTELGKIASIIGKRPGDDQLEIF